MRVQALSATRSLLHAAALAGRPPADLFRWSHTAGASKEAVTILGTCPGATPGWDRALDAVISADERTRDSVWAMVANTFAPLADPAVLAAVTPEEGAELDPLAFLALGGTVYLLGTATGASATATLVAALIEDLVDDARRLAARCPGQRLDPPLALVLDEAPNYPLPSLPSLMSEGGGSGITTVAVLQSLAQARDRWGREAAQAIWDSAIVKVVLGGSASADDLADLSRLLGEREIREWSETRHGGSMARSLSSSTRYRPVLEPSELRRLGFGSALLLLRSAPPVMLSLRPWTTRPTRRHCVPPERRGSGRPAVREPRPGLVWSLRRARCRAEYSAWMGGEAWLARRADWYRRWVAAHGAEPVCQVCGATLDAAPGPPAPPELCPPRARGRPRPRPAVPQLPSAPPPGARVEPGLAPGRSGPRHLGHHRAATAHSKERT